jgi:hypothetical protein
MKPADNRPYIHRLFAIVPGGVTVTWLPAFHDMGLMKRIIQLYKGRPAM